MRSRRISEIASFEKISREEARLIVAANPLLNGESPISSRFSTNLLSEEAWRDRYYNSSIKEFSKHVIVVEDDKPAAKMTEQVGESCHDCMKRSQLRDSSPELFSDPHKT